jgi:hypothetical protein
MSVSIADLDDDFTKSDPSKGPERANKLADLPDGDYDFAVRSAVFKEAAEGKPGPVLVSLTLAVFAPGTPHDGVEGEHVYFLVSKEGKKNTVALNILKKDLLTLGFDVNSWTRENGRPFSKQLVLALGVIEGVEFKGKKKRRDEKNFNLFVNERSATDGRPATFGPAELVAPSAGFDV